jgi:phospholipid/cholesterol/gamma-HCH transport system substrate-binding protein
METRANHVLIGAFTIVGVLVAVAFGLWAGRYTSSASWADYEIRFSQAVTGLSAGGAVQYNGITVGTVRELFLAPEDPRQVVAHIRIRADAPVKQDTVARLTLAGLTGATFIQLTGGSPESPTRQVAPGDLLPRIPAEESAMQRLLGASEGIADAANEVMMRVIELLSEENVQRVGESLANVHAVTGTLSAEQTQIRDTLKSIATAAANAERALAGADQTVAQLNETLRKVDEGLIARLPELGNDMAVTMQQLASLMERADTMLADSADMLSSAGTGTIGQLAPTLQELQLLLQTLSRVTRRIDRDPTQFLLGGSQPEEYQPR